LPVRIEQAPNVPVAVQRHTGRFAGIILAVFLAITGLVVSIVLRAQRRAQMAPSTAQAPLPAVAAAALASAPPPWNPMIPGPVLLIDVNGDSVEDIVSRHRNVSDGDAIAIGALDGKNGELLWRSDKLGTYSQLYGGGLWFDGSHLYIASDSGKLFGLDTAGKLIGTHQLDEKLDKLCKDGEILLVLTKDKRAREIAAELGSPIDRPTGCKPLANDSRGAGTVFERHHHFLKSDFQDMRVDFALPMDDGWVLAVGSKTPGTAVPMLARYRADVDPLEDPTPPMPRARNAVHLSRLMKRQKAELNKKRELLSKAEVSWIISVPQENPLTAHRIDKHHISADGNSVAAVYDGANGDMFLVLFDVVTGKARFEEKLPSASNVQSVTIKGDSVYLSSFSGVAVHDAQKGHLRFSAGR
jgi:outer membrane protein assembly factor BamB